MANQNWTELAQGYLSRSAEVCAWIGRVVAYPFHVLFRLVARLCLLVATTLSILLTVLLAPPIVFRLAQAIGDTAVWQNLYGPLADFLGGPSLLQYSTFLMSLGVAGTVLVAVGKAAWKKAKELWGLVLCASEGEWRPKFWNEEKRCPNRVVDSVKKTWSKYVATILPAVGKSFHSSLKLILALLAIAAVLAAAWFGQRRPANEDNHVVVVQAPDVVPEMVRMYLRQGAVFSLMDMDNAKLSKPNSGRGICLNGDGLEWLRNFKKAMKRCMREAKPADFECKDGKDRCPVLKVTGYASVAPVTGDVSEDCGPNADEAFNCKVANLRARAVGAFLVDGEDSHWECPDQGKYFNGATTCPAEHCDGKSRHLRMIGANDRSIGIVVDQWASEIQMREGKPANDGSRPDNRRYRVEVMNRAVHIEVLRDFCAMPESLT